MFWTRFPHLWWCRELLVIFVKAKMWFGSGRDSASLSSSGRSLILLCVWFLPPMFMILVGVLTFDSNCIFAWLFLLLSLPHQLQVQVIKKKKGSLIYVSNCHIVYLHKMYHYQKWLQKSNFHETVFMITGNVNFAAGPFFVIFLLIGWLTAQSKYRKL